MLEQKLYELVLILVTISGVATAIWWLMKFYFDKKYQLALHLQQAEKPTNANATLHLRLAAYERLLILCERIAIPNLISRLRTEGGTSGELRLAMLIAIQQEFEHNVTQQIYVSENLWAILQAARNNTAEIINLVAAKTEAQADQIEFIRQMTQFFNENADNSLQTAQNAIRQEAALAQ